MHANSSQAKSPQQTGRVVLAIDTCGPSGSVALGRHDAQKLEILGQMELAGRSYSAKLVAAVCELLAKAEVGVKDLGAIVAVNGPGSFTGVRVGLSAVKGLAEPKGIPVVAVSRLEVLARNAACVASALDAHRHEVFLRMDDELTVARELLAGAEELQNLKQELKPIPARIAVCDDGAPALLLGAWPGAELVRLPAPTAADALTLAAPRILAGQFVDLALLDGHYLRRSDAEIFGDPEALSIPQKSSNPQRSARPPAIRIQAMAAENIDVVMAIARSLPEAPDWAREAYLAAVDPLALPRRIALVAENSGTAGVAGFAISRLMPPEAELETIAVAAERQRRGIARQLFAALTRELRRQRVTEVSLEVRDSNRAARAFYASLGFAESGRRPRYYVDPVEDAVLMHLRLDG